MRSSEKGQRVPVHEGAGAARPEPQTGLRTLAPAVDIYEEGEDLHLLVDLPGVTQEAVQLDVDKDVLTIQAKLPGEGLFPGEAVYSELGPVAYHRAFALGEDLDAGRITANMKNGVLELVVPKAERAKTRKIKIEQA